ncbi:hypothetical protein EN801_032145 [Mesorhizobium sp. M00.F.Ca.ET.158.01.1.1]|nr:hypothetical protein EN801_032145 [Mesorhizobium sp. M00.F.Ca.ET.158.01.1.1]
MRFTFDGVAYTGHGGDTLASALLANGVTLFGRSFKYHRPRGLLSAGVEEPNALVTVLKGEFKLSEDQAHRVMITAHRHGVCVVAVFTRDVAETKATRATDAGKAKGYPLLFTTEPEE